MLKPKHMKNDNLDYGFEFSKISCTAGKRPRPLIKASGCKEEYFNTIQSHADTCLQVKKVV
jgi:hypothetical protein